jgi:hypothetical protein
MGIFDRLNDTKRPPGDVAPRSAADVWDALVGLNGPEVPYVVRDGRQEGADLVAEWRILEPAWRTFFARTQVKRTLQVCMRLVPAQQEVRSIDRMWEVNWVGGRPGVALSGTYSRGQVRTVTREWTIGRKDDGRFGLTETYRFDPSELKHPLQSTVLKAGWTWRGVAFGKL